MTEHAKSARHGHKLEEWKRNAGIGGQYDPNNDDDIGEDGGIKEDVEQFMDQMSAGQTQMVARMPKPPNANRHDLTAQFEIYVSKDTFKFNASHFVAFPGFRERLHGHNYRVSVRLVGSRKVGGDGYVLDFGCVKEAVKTVCMGLNEYFLVPMLSDVLTITCSDVSVTIMTEDGCNFVFPRDDCILLPIVHSTAEELAVYLYGKILGQLDAKYMRQRGVTEMAITVSEGAGQDATFRREIPKSGTGEGSFDVAAYVSKGTIPPMCCATDTESAAKRQKTGGSEFPV
jgi:6-pyruvoyltetrahydropterin/6-carboxytetrahydropterin synthase